jgi:hypothetical protein
LYDTWGSAYNKGYDPGSFDVLPDPAKPDDPSAKIVSFKITVSAKDENNNTVSFDMDLHPYSYKTHTSALNSIDYMKEFYGLLAAEGFKPVADLSQDNTSTSDPYDKLVIFNITVKSTSDPSKSFQMSVYPFDSMYIAQNYNFETYPIGQALSALNSVKHVQQFYDALLVKYGNAEYKEEPGLTPNSKVPVFEVNAHGETLKFYPFGQDANGNSVNNDVNEALESTEHLYKLRDMLIDLGLNPVLKSKPNLNSNIKEAKIYYFEVTVPGSRGASFKTDVYQYGKAEAGGEFELTDIENTKKNLEIMRDTYKYLTQNHKVEFKLADTSDPDFKIPYFRIIDGRFNSDVYPIASKDQEQKPAQTIAENAEHLYDTYDRLLPKYKIKFMIKQNPKYPDDITQKISYFEITNTTGSPLLTTEIYPYDADGNKVASDNLAQAADHIYDSWFTMHAKLKSIFGPQYDPGWVKYEPYKTTDENDNEIYIPVFDVNIKVQGQQPFEIKVYPFKDETVLAQAIDKDVVANTMFLAETYHELDAAGFSIDAVFEVDPESKRTEFSNFSVTGKNGTSVDVRFGSQAVRDPQYYDNGKLKMPVYPFNSAGQDKNAAAKTKKIFEELKKTTDQGGYALYQIVPLEIAKHPFLPNKEVVETFRYSMFKGSKNYALFPFKEGVYTGLSGIKTSSEMINDAKVQDDIADVKSEVEKAGLKDFFFFMNGLTPASKQEDIDQAYYDLLNPALYQSKSAKDAVAQMKEVKEIYESVEKLLQTPNTMFFSKLSILKEEDKKTIVDALFGTNLARGEWPASAADFNYGRQLTGRNYSEAYKAISGSLYSADGGRAALGGWLELFGQDKTGIAGLLELIAYGNKTVNRAGFLTLGGSDERGVYLTINNDPMLRLYVYQAVGSNRLINSVFDMDEAIHNLFAVAGNKELIKKIYTDMGYASASVYALTLGRNPNLEKQLEEQVLGNDVYMILPDGSIMRPYNGDKPLTATQVGNQILNEQYRRQIERDLSTEFGTIQRINVNEDGQWEFFYNKTTGEFMGTARRANSELIAVDVIKGPFSETVMDKNDIVNAIKNKGKMAKLQRDYQAKHGQSVQIEEVFTLGEQYYWKVTAGGQTYNIIPTKNDGKVLMLEEFEKTVSDAPFIDIAIAAVNQGENKGKVVLEVDAKTGTIMLRVGDPSNPAKVSLYAQMPGTQEYGLLGIDPKKLNKENVEKAVKAHLGIAQQLRDEKLKWTQKGFHIAEKDGIWFVSHFDTDKYRGIDNRNSMVINPVGVNEDGTLYVEVDLDKAYELEMVNREFRARSGFAVTYLNKNGSPIQVRPKGKKLSLLWEVDRLAGAGGMQRVFLFNDAKYGFPKGSFAFLNKFFNKQTGKYAYSYIDGATGQKINATADDSSTIALAVKVAALEDHVRNMFDLADYKQKVIASGKYDVVDTDEDGNALIDEETGITFWKVSRKGGKKLTSTRVTPVYELDGTIKAIYSDENFNTIENALSSWELMEQVREIDKLFPDEKIKVTKIVDLTSKTKGYQAKWKITALVNGKEITTDVTPFNFDGTLRTLPNIVNALQAAKVFQDAKESGIKFEGGEPVYVDNFTKEKWIITEFDGKSVSGHVSGLDKIEIYPFNTKGELTIKNLAGLRKKINNVLDVERLRQAAEAAGMTVTSRTVGDNVIWTIETVVNGVQIKVDDFYVYKKDGSVANMGDINKAVEIQKLANDIMAANPGLKLKKHVDGNKDVYFTVDGFANIEDYRIYPVNEKGEVISFAEMMRAISNLYIKKAAIDNGSNGAYIETADTSVAAIKKTRTENGKTIKGVEQIIKEITESGQLNGKSDEESAEMILEALSALPAVVEQIDYKTDEDGDGKADKGESVTVIADVERTKDGKYTVVYKKEYFRHYTDADGKSQKAWEGESYFVDHGGTLYEQWFKKDVQARITAEMKVNIKAEGLSSSAANEIAYVLKRNGDAMFGEMLAGLDAMKKYELKLDDKKETANGKTVTVNRKAVFEKDAAGNITVSVLQSKDNGGNWEKTGNSKFEYSGGQGILVTPFYLIDKEQVEAGNKKTAFLVNAMFLSDLKTNDNFVTVSTSRFGQNVLEHILYDANGKEIRRFQQGYGEAYKVSNRERISLINAVNRGDIKTFEISPMKAFVANKVQGKTGAAAAVSSQKGRNIVEQWEVAAVLGADGTTYEYYDNGAVRLFVQEDKDKDDEIVIRDVVNDSGITLNGKNTEKTDASGAPIYRIAPVNGKNTPLVSRYRTVDFKDLANEGLDIIDIVQDLKRQNPQLKYELENLTWTRTEKIDDSGNPTYIVWEAYSEGSGLPLVNIRNNNVSFTDYIITQNEDGSITTQTTSPILYDAAHTESDGDYYARLSWFQKFLYNMSNFFKSSKQEKNVQKAAILSMDWSSLFLPKRLEMDVKVLFTDKDWQNYLQALNAHDSRYGEAKNALEVLNINDPLLQGKESLKIFDATDAKGNRIIFDANGKEQSIGKDDPVPQGWKVKLSVDPKTAEILQEKLLQIELDETGKPVTRDRGNMEYIVKGSQTDANGKITSVILADKKTGEEKTVNAKEYYSDYNLKMVPSDWLKNSQEAAEIMQTVYTIWDQLKQNKDDQIYYLIAHEDGNYHGEFKYKGEWYMGTGQDLIDRINATYTYFDYDQMKETAMNLPKAGEKLNGTQLRQIYQFLYYGQTDVYGNQTTNLADPKTMKEDPVKYANDRLKAISGEINLVAAIRSVDLYTSRLKMPRWLGWVDWIDRKLCNGQLLEIKLNSIVFVGEGYKDIHIQAEGNVLAEDMASLRDVAYSPEGGNTYVMSDLFKPGPENIVGPLKFVKEATHTKLFQAIAPVFLMVLFMLAAFGGNKVTAIKKRRNKKKEEKKKREFFNSEVDGLLKVLYTDDNVRQTERKAFAQDEKGVIKENVDNGFLKNSLERDLESKYANDIFDALENKNNNNPEEAVKAVFEEYNNKPVQPVQHALLVRMFELGVVKTDDMRSVLEAMRAKDEEIMKKAKARQDVLSEFTKRLTAKIVNDEYKKLAPYLPKELIDENARGEYFYDSEGRNLTDRLMAKLVNEMYNTLITHPERLEKKEDGANNIDIIPYSIQMGAQDLRELILYELLTLPVSYSQDSSMGANASLKPSTMYLVRKMLEIIDDKDMSEKEKRDANTNRIKQLLDFSRILTVFCGGDVMKKTSEPGDPTRIDSSVDRTSLKDLFIDFDWIYLFGLLTTDYDQNLDKTHFEASKYDMFSLSEKHQKEVFKRIIELIKKEKPEIIFENSSFLAEIAENDKFNAIKKAIKEYIETEESVMIAKITKERPEILTANTKNGKTDKKKAMIDYRKAVEKEYQEIVELAMTAKITKERPEILTANTKNGKTDKKKAIADYISIVEKKDRKTVNTEIITNEYIDSIFKKYKNTTNVSEQKKIQEIKNLVADMRFLAGTKTVVDDHITSLAEAEYKSKRNDPKYKGKTEKEIKEDIKKNILADLLAKTEKTKINVVNSIVQYVGKDAADMSVAVKVGRALQADISDLAKAVSVSKEESEFRVRGLRSILLNLGKKIGKNDFKVTKEEVLSNGYYSEVLKVIGLDNDKIEAMQNGAVIDLKQAIAKYLLGMDHTAADLDLSGNAIKSLVSTADMNDVKIRLEKLDPALAKDVADMKNFIATGKYKAMNTGQKAKARQLSDRGANVNAGISYLNDHWNKPTGESKLHEAYNKSTTINMNRVKGLRNVLHKFDKKGIFSLGNKDFKVKKEELLDGHYSEVLKIIGLDDDKIKAMEDGAVIDLKQAIAKYLLGMDHTADNLKLSNKEAVENLAMHAEMNAVKKRLENLTSALDDDVKNMKAFIEEKTGKYNAMNDSQKAKVRGLFDIGNAVNINLSYLDNNWGATPIKNFLRTTFGRYGKAILGFDFWNIETKSQKFWFWTLTGTFLAVAAAAFLFLTPIGIGVLAGWGITGISTFVASMSIGELLSIFSYNIIITFIIFAITIPKAIVGKADDKGLKRSILGVNTVFSMYYGGVLGAFFFRGLSIAINSISAGFLDALFPGSTLILSFVIWVLVAIPTYSAIWHLMIGNRADIKQKYSNDTKTFRATEKRLALQKIGTLFLITGGLSLLGMSGLGLFIIPAIMILAGLGSIGASYFFLGDFNKKQEIVSLDRSESKIPDGTYAGYVKVGMDLDNPGKSLYASAKKSNFEKMFEGFDEEYKALDDERNYLGYQTYTDYMVNTINSMEGDRLLSPEEAELIRKAINGEEGGRFIMPRDMKARRTIRSALAAVGQNKPEIPSWDKMWPVTEHVQSYTEIAGWSIFKLLDKNSFHSGQTVLGYMISNCRARWSNSVVYIVQLQISKDITD